MELQPENALARWAPPECPFAVEYSPRVLDDIRLAVTDAFFSLPRGGVEIGGLLLGRHDNGRVTILASMPVECEHAFGPSFVFSERDQAKLAELVAAANNNPRLEPVGWWHSHTRSEIFLSDADRQIHDSFFPEPWQVALVLKPHTFQPMRAGFFFREKDGSIRAEATCQEIALEAMPMRPAGAAAPPPVSAPPQPADTGGLVINIAGYVEPEPAAVDPPHDPAGVAPPAFLSAADPPPRDSRRWIGWIAAAFGVALALAGYSTRDRWLSAIDARLGPSPVDTIALNALDQSGQLQVRWNGAAPPVQSAQSGSLLILDGSSTVNVPLDAPHVRSGAFTYQRRSGRVDVTLALPQGGGKELRVATLFTGGPPPAQMRPSEDTTLRQERDSLRDENATLKTDLGRQVERNRVLEKALEEMRKAVQREHQRKRLEAQSPDAAK